MRHCLKSRERTGQWWRAPLIPASGRQRQANLSEFEASLVYKVSSRTGSKATQRNPVSKKSKQGETKERKL